MPDTAVMAAATNNLLIWGLDASSRNALLRATEPTALASGAILAIGGRRVAQAIFPIDCSISLTLPTPDQSQVEAGLIGREGMLGIALVLGARVSALHAVVQVAGRAWCVDAAHFTAQLECDAALRLRLNRYAHVRLVQSTHGATCRNLHRVEARLARWLLMSRDRARSGDFALTHERLALILGVRRAGVSIAAGALQERGLIHYSRGHISLLENRGLEAAACACYENDKRIYARLMG
jgi:CRP-like cAMP-binding protein